MGGAGRLVIGRLLVQILALGRAELHVKVSLSEILNPTLLISEGPAMSWPLVQGVEIYLSAVRVTLKDTLIYLPAHCQIQNFVIILSPIFLNVSF